MFCVKCGTRLEDEAMFCFNCGNKVGVEMPVEQTVMEQQPMQDQRQYTMHGSFQPVQQQPVEMSAQQQAYEKQEMPTQAFYNTPAQVSKKSNTSVAGMILLVLALLASVAISIGHFLDGEVGMGIANIGYVAATICLIVYCVSNKRIGSILKGISLIIVLGVNIAFAGISAIGASFDIFGNAKAGIDYYYAIVLLLQYVFLYLYLIVSIIRSFMGKVKTSLATCLCGYFAVLFTIAAFVIDFVSDTPSIFVLSVIPVDLGIITLIGGDIFATLRKGKNVE